MLPPTQGGDRGDRHGELPRDPVVAGDPPLLGLGITAVGIAVAAVVVVSVEPLRTGIGHAVQGDTDALRESVRALGAGGVALLLGLCLLHAIVWYPAEIVDAAAGFVYGFGGGLALAMAGWLVNGIVAYWIGRHAARPALFRRLGRDRFLRYERLVARGGVPLLLSMRLIPIVPFSLFSYVAGSARVPLGRFVWTTGVGYLPLTAIFVYLGSRLEELSATDPLIWIGVAILIVLLLLSRLLGRFERDDAPEPPTADPDARNYETAATAAAISSSEGDSTSSR